jgi:hypothetical protein
MKATLLTTIKHLLTDRFMTTLIVALLLTGVAYALYVGLTLQPSDLQVATRYTSFGNTHFYRNKWYYLISFAVFGLVVAGMHAAVAVKLYGRGQRQWAVFLTALTLLIFVIAWITARSVLRVAFL